MEQCVFLYDLPPALIEQFCTIIDCGDERFGWRALASRIVPSWLEVRRAERLEASGQSPTRELLWAWAQQNRRLSDLVSVLQDMGHLRALHLLASTGPSQEWASASSGEPPKPSGPSGLKQRHVITYQDVLTATKNFHPDMKLSEGCFSDTYRGCVKDQTFVVKRYRQVTGSSWRKSWDAFVKESEEHRLHQHPNLLELLGCFPQESFYCLVYPFLPNGSLHHRLHSQGCRPLSWQERLVVIKGTAKALHHLHHARPAPLVCGTLSSSNILLDDNLWPKISDLGVICLRPPLSNHSVTITVDTGFHSNLGYLPEEYIRNGKLSLSLDVYSFGMVVMETTTGRKVLQETARQAHLRELLTAELEDRGTQDCVRLLDQHAGPWPRDLAQTLLDLAVHCTGARPKTRPPMERVLQVLSRMLPLPGCPPSDQLHTLSSEAPPPEALTPDLSASPDLSAPMEDDEQHSFPLSDPRCLAAGAGLRARPEVDLYNSWPVQCSCGAEAGTACDDCRANGFTPDPPGHNASTSPGVAENDAKQRLRSRMDLYNQDLLRTKEQLKL